VTVYAFRSLTHSYACSRSNVIEDITARIGLQGDATLYFVYYNYRNAQLSDLSQIIAALVQQLCRKKDRIPRDLLQVKHEGLSPSLAGTQDRFVSLVEELQKVYVVFDAIDECPEQEREAILGFITGIVAASILCHVKVFATSRREMDIAEAFEDKRIPTIQIRAENVAADIETFARAREHGKRLYITSDELKEKIIQTLAVKAEAMYVSS
jgi:hypothetical protein